MRLLKLLMLIVTWERVAGKIFALAAFFLIVKNQEYCDDVTFKIISVNILDPNT